MSQHFKVIFILMYPYSPELVRCFSSLAQAVTSQAEHNKHLNGVVVILKTR